MNSMNFSQIPNGFNTGNTTPTLKIEAASDSSESESDDKPSSTQLDEELRDLRDRVESLEISNSIVSEDTETLLELVKIITEIPAGQQIFNRAINRQKLNKLKEIVLPRRQAALIEIVDEEMPEELKEQFVKDEMKLIASVIRVISHREHFEEYAAQSVRDTLTKLFTKISKSKSNQNQLVDVSLLNRKTGKHTIIEMKQHNKHSHSPKHGKKINNRKLVAASERCWLFWYKEIEVSIPRFTSQEDSFMPTLNEVTGTETATGVDANANAPALETSTQSAGVVDATVVETTTETPATGKTKKAKKTTPAATTVPATEKPTKAKKEKKVATDGDSGKSEEDKLRRPPMEMIHKDVETLILDEEIAGHKIKNLGYKCGKIIYGLKSESGKDFRVIALKARKKTKSVERKSRCIYYFGISEDHSTIVKDIPGTKTTTFGKCSVQSKKPIELILDKTSFKESFDQSDEKVVKAISKLIKLTVHQKTSEWKSLQAKLKDKATAKKEATEKKEASAKKEPKQNTFFN